MYGLPLLDIIVIIVYFLGMIGIGLWSMSRIKNQEDYFLGGRRFGKLIQTFASFGQSVTADSSVGTVTTTFTNGVSGVWSSLLYLPSTPLYWIVAPWLRRLRVQTTGDFFEERYGSKRMAATYAVLGTICMMAYLSVGFSAMSKTILALTPKTVDKLTQEELHDYRLAEELDGLRQADYTSLDNGARERLKELQLLKPRKVFSHLSKDVLIWIVCFIVLIYTVTGGLMAAFISDTIQGIFIIILTFILIPFGWAKINTIYGGSGVFSALRTIHEQLPQSYFEIFGSPSAIDFTWYYIAAIGIMSSLNTPSQPNTMVVVGSAKDEYTARFGFVTGLFMKRFSTIFWGLFALTAIVLYHESVHDPDYVWGYATLNLLGPLKLGLVGLMIACLTAALMSTADCLMLTSSSLITQNIYKPLFSGRNENHYIFIGRIMGAMVIIGGALIATQFDTILQLLKFIWEFNVIIAASFWLGLKWRRPTRTAAWWSIVSTLILFFILPMMLPTVFQGIRTAPDCLKMTDPPPILRSYTAHEMDIEVRNREIEAWDKRNEQGKAEGVRPTPLTSGQGFKKTFVLEPKAVFWTKGMKSVDGGRLKGSGMFNLELYLLHKAGFDLTKQPHALNQTMRILIRMVFPFVVLIIASLITIPDDRKRLDRFYAKMKTPVKLDRDEDTSELQKSYDEPHRFDHVKLFPGSQLEFYRWNKVDSIGFLLSIAAVAGIIGLLFVLISIGG